MSFPTIMDSRPLVSVIIATYNAAATLQRCIDSVSDQTYVNKELIIIDGGSKDNTIEILTKNNEKIKYWKSEPDHGIYDAWNKALKQAHGDYVCFLGADDYWCQNESLEKLVECGRINNFPDIVSAKVAIIDSDGSILTEKGDAWDYVKMQKYMLIAHPGMLQRRNLFDRFGTFSTKYKIAGDYDFFLRLPQEVTHAFVNEPVVKMGVGGKSRTNFNEVMFETYNIQAHNKNIGTVKAGMNIFVAYLKYIARRLLCKKY